MRAFRRIDGLACPLPLANVDTDQLIPARFMKEPRSVGYGQFLLHDLRFDAHGAPRDELALNHPDAGRAEILVARRNFGAGSSREAAVYALVDFGFRCVIAPSFGDIFAANAVNNGVLPAVLEDDEVEQLLAALGGRVGPMQVDLESRRIHCGERVFDFSIDAVWRDKLLAGRDDIDQTLQYRERIEAFAAERLRRYPWLDARE